MAGKRKLRYIQELGGATIISSVIKHRYTPATIFCLVNIITMLGIFSDTILMFVLPSLFLVVAIFRFCEYVDDNTAVFTYLLVMLAVFAVIGFLLRGRGTSFYLWLRAGDLAGSEGFFIALFIFCVFMFSSAVYYFTFVQHRILMLFVLTVANPILLRFRQESVHPFAIALLIVLLFFIINKAKAKVFLPFAVPIFAVAFLTAVVFSQRDGMLDIGDGESGSTRTMGFARYSQPSREGSNRILFLVEADEPLYLVSQVFGSFDGTRWHGIFERPFSAGFFNWESYFEAAHMGTFLNILHTHDIPYLPDFTESVGSARIIHQDVTTHFILAPPRAFRIDGTPDEVRHIKNSAGEIFISDAGGRHILPEESEFTVYYFRDVFRTTPALQGLSARLVIDDWIYIISDTEPLRLSPDWEYDMGIFSFMARLQDKTENTRDFPQFVGEYENPRITALARQITEGLTTDYQKAVALENYFRSFYYSLNEPPQGIEHFLFESRTGACVEFATAMTLMSRSIGLNARYVEGFIAEEQNEYGQFVVRESHGHAFTQIFFAPYGWVTFEPTQGQIIEPQGQGLLGLLNANILTDNIPVIFTFLSIACVLGFAGYLLYVYVLVEKFFRRRALKSDNSHAVILLFKQLLRLVETKTGTTNLSAMQLTDLVRARYNIEIYPAAAYYERAMYNNETLCQKSKDEVYSIYLSLYPLVK